MLCKKLMTAALAIALVVMGAAQAGAEVTYTYSFKPALPEIETLLQAFFGEDAQKMSGRDMEDRIAYYSDDRAYECEIEPATGHFWILKPSDIPIHYRSEGEGASLPLPSEEPGKYTAQEADALVRETLQKLLGIPARTLEASRVIHENPDKEKSRAYRFYYHYSLDGRPLIPISAAVYTPIIEAGFTDDGLVYASGVSLAIENKEESREKVLGLDEMMKRNPWMASFGTHQLAYYLKPGKGGSFITQPVWYAYDLESWFSGQVYSATTGKQIPIE